MVSNKFGDLVLIKIGTRGIISEPPEKNSIPLHIRSSDSRGLSSGVHDPINGTTSTILPRGLDEGTYSNGSSTVVQTSPSATLRRRRPPQIAPVNNEDRIQGYVCCHLFCLYLANLSI
jgi:hypothetical protein